MFAGTGIDPAGIGITSPPGVELCRTAAADLDKIYSTRRRWPDVPKRAEFEEAFRMLWSEKARHERDGNEPAADIATNTSGYLYTLGRKLGGVRLRGRRFDKASLECLRPPKYQDMAWAVSMARGIEENVRTPGWSWPYDLVRSCVWGAKQLAVLARVHELRAPRPAFAMAGSPRAGTAI